MNFLSVVLVVVSGLTVAPALVDAQQLDCAGAVSEELRSEIAGFAPVIDRIVQYVMEGAFKGRTYDELAKFVDKFGARPSGTVELERSIDYIIALSAAEGLTDVTTEDLPVPYIVRGEEVITMREPWVKNLHALGLGHTADTPPGGLTAEVVAVASFEEFDALPAEAVRGKIVVWDPQFTVYAATNLFRTQGARRAAERGAAASLVRSVAPFSIDAPHTGTTNFGDVEPIPAAAITLEDADLIRRIYDRGEKVVVHIQMSSTLAQGTSRNTLIDFKGRESPEKLVFVSGHIDSWDVGQGAMDDGGGIFIGWAASVILNRLNLRPRRTIRAAYWTAEELGLIGAIAYEQRHRNESYNINFILESDQGTFAPLGLQMAGTREARCIVAEVLKLFEVLNATRLEPHDSPGSDLTVFTRQGIPGASLMNANERYFWFHHTEGDMMNVEDPTELDQGAAFWAALSYIVAELSVDLPRAGDREVPPGTDAAPPLHHPAHHLLLLLGALLCVFNRASH